MGWMPGLPLAKTRSTGLPPSLTPDKVDPRRVGVVVEGVGLNAQ